MNTIFGVRGDFSSVTILLKAGSNVILHNVVATTTPNVVRFYAVTDNPNKLGAFIVQFSHAEIGELFITTPKPLSEDEIKDLICLAESNYAESEQA
jgi:hypothetical protein